MTAGTHPKGMLLKLTRIAKLAVWLSLPVLLLSLGLLLSGHLVDLVGETQCEIAFRPRLQRKFEKGLWLNATQETGNRYALANWLVDSDFLNGLSTNAVFEHLGQPSSKELEGNLLCWDYTLARQSDFPARSLLVPFGFSNMDYWYLRICFAEDRVAGKRIVVK